MIDARIEARPDWQGELLSRVRRLITEADPDVVGEVIWRKSSKPMGVPVWAHDGVICSGEAYRDNVKLTFAKGASLEDPAGLFNASLDGEFPAPDAYRPPRRGGPGWARFHPRCEQLPYITI